MNNQKLPNSNDIFIRSQNDSPELAHQAQRGHEKKRGLLKTTGAILGLTMFVFVVNAVVVLSRPISQAQSANEIAGATTPKTTPGIMQFLPKKETPDMKTVNQAQIKATTPANASTFTVTNPPTTTYNTVATNIAAVTPIEDMDTIKEQINAASESIFSNMQECIDLAKDAQTDISDMRTREQQLQTEITRLGREMVNLPNDDNRASRRAELIDQRDDVINDRNQLLRTLNQRKGEFNRAISDCRNIVYRQQTSKRMLESQLNNAFNRAVRISAY